LDFGWWGVLRRQRGGNQTHKKPTNPGEKETTARQPREGPLEGTVGDNSFQNGPVAKTEKKTVKIPQNLFLGPNRYGRKKILSGNEGDRGKGEGKKPRR